MVGFIAVCTGFYLLGAIFWFMVYYTEWDFERKSHYCDADKRRYYASQMLATPMWPAGLFRNLLILIGMAKEDVHEEY